MSKSINKSFIACVIYDVVVRIDVCIDIVKLLLQIHFVLWRSKLNIYFIFTCSSNLMEHFMICFDDVNSLRLKLHELRRFICPLKPHRK